MGLPGLTSFLSQKIPYGVFAHASVRAWCGAVLLDAMQPGTGPYADLHERVSALVVTETSQDGSVTVEVGADGAVRGLVLRERGHDIEHYADVIMACLGAAQARIPDLVAKAVDTTVGAADPGADLVLTDLRKRFPRPEPVESVARKPKRPPVDEDTDDWAGGRIMEDTI
jgi:hypothetical protein